MPISKYPLGGGGSLNVQDDRRFSTTTERDAAIPSPAEGEQCTIESSMPQYHLLQEYRTDAWVDITYLIEGPEGPQGAAGGGLVQVGKNGSFTEIEFIEIGENLDVFIEGEGETGRATIVAVASEGIKITPLTEDDYFDFSNFAWSTVIADKSSGDIAYFSTQGLGSKFSNLPGLISLNASTNYVIVSEVTTRNGFAHRISVASSSGNDDANNRTAQRAGSTFDSAKDQWAEATLRRDAVVYSDMTASTSEVFSTITAGTNMTGTVVDGVLTLDATAPDDRNEFDTLHARALMIHENDSESGVFTEFTIDGNKNTIVRAVGDTHYYMKNRSTSELIEAFQVDSSGRFVVKQKVKTPVITNLSTGTTNSNSDRAGFIDLSVDGEVKLGAKSKVSFNVNGSGVVEISGTELKILQGLNANNKSITSIKHLVGNSAGTMNVAGVKLIKRDDSSDNTQAIQINSGDITAYSDKHEWKTNDNARRLTIENHEANWHDCKLTNIADADSDKGAPNLAQVQALISASGEGDSFKKVKLDVGGSPTYYEHNGDSHLYIEYSGNGGTVSIDTMRNGSEQQSDLVLMHNTKSTNAFIRLFYDGSSDLIELPGYSYVVGWTNRDIGRWVTMTSKSAMQIPVERIVLADELTWTATDDPRENTKRIIAAAPDHCTIIGYHNKDNSNKKYHIVSRADTDKSENIRSTFFINKKASGHATGMSTTEGGIGDKVWSRVLDGVRGAWDTADTSNAFGLSTNINLDSYPEETLAFTTDRGLMRINMDGNGDKTLLEVDGFNIPDLQAQINEKLHLSEVHDAIDARMNAKEIKSPFTNAQSVQIDVSHLDHPDVTVYVTDGTKLKKVKPAISKDLVSGLLQVDFINPKSGLIVVRSH